MRYDDESKSNEIEYDHLGMLGAIILILLIMIVIFLGLTSHRYILEEQKHRHIIELKGCGK